MATPEEVSEWLVKSDEDWRVVEILLREDFAPPMPCLFHMQQMLEKLLKALLLARGKSVERTHDLARLAQLADVDDVEGLMDHCEVLNLFSVAGRYPGDLPDLHFDEVRSFHDKSQQFRKILLEVIAPLI